ncbi:MAG: Stp1/IreP family PP2C-type Ser/Thr phosphatase [Oscillospiraceae bacterium]|nr:Stp1/IreP family PP2C-type Ser/Thr phosphatase [Oscillospiraceae bacterium]
MKIAKKTDAGMVRSVNQDACAAGEFPDGMVWAVVCDGMGGASGGDIASSAAVRIIAEKITASYRDGMSSTSIRHLLFSAIETANATVFEMSRANEELEGMGTTVVAAIISGKASYIAHAGDSRAYRIFGRSISQLTRDHSMVQAMLENGELTPTQAKRHPRKNIITRVLGVDGTILIDFCEEPFLDGDILLICTDGLTNFVDADEIYKVARESDKYMIADELVKLANYNGGRDNITVVTVSN